MNRTISISELKKIVTESNGSLDNFEITEDVIDELLEMSGDEIEQRTERLVREIARDALEKALVTVKGGDFEENVGEDGLVHIRISALATPLFKNAKELIRRTSTGGEADSVDITDAGDDEYLEETSFGGGNDEDDYEVELVDGKWTKRPKTFSDDWNRFKKNIKNKFRRAGSKIGGNTRMSDDGEYALAESIQITDR